MINLKMLNKDKEDKPVKVKDKVEYYILSLKSKKLKKIKLKV